MSTQNQGEYKMKTLRQWYDGLSINAKEWMQKHCDDWFDANEEDCYKKPSKGSTEGALTAYHATFPETPRYYDNLNRQDTIKMLLESLRHNPDITQAKIDMLVKDLVKSYKGDCCNDIHMYASEDIRKEIFLKRHNERYGDDSMAVDIDHYLYLIKDYDEMYINWDELYHDRTLNTAIMDEIIGRKNFLQVVKKSDPVGFAEQIPDRQRNELFDALFFCEDGWSHKTKLDILHKRYIYPLCKGETERNLRVFADFMERIVCVDHSYLRYIYKFVEEVPSIANDIYEQKKPSDELTGNETIPQTYRYPKDIRKLAKIAHACARKSVSKANSAFLKEISPLLRLYGYNFNDIYDALYPEDESIYNNQ